jgi:hypothetical protein
LIRPGTKTEVRFSSSGSAASLSAEEVRPHPSFAGAKMNAIRSTYKATRLNWSETGWGVVNDRTGALARLDGGLALRLTEEEAHALAAKRSEIAARRKGRAANDDHDGASGR